jgi:predicted Holliday junction resolvase-like endonuclease
MDLVTIFLVIVTVFLGVAFIIFIFRYIALVRTVETLAKEQFDLWRDSELEKSAREHAEILNREWIINREKSTRAEAVKQSGATIRGNITQHLIPYFPDFAWNPRDVRFLGTPVDLVVFSGLSEKDELDSIVFIEVKTGKTGSLSESQKKVKRYLEQGGKVTFEQVHTGTHTDAPL